MITVVQRVRRASVRVDGATIGAIDDGLLLLIGVERGDGDADADTTARKVLGLRVFPGARPTDRSVQDIGGGCLVISQFTLAGELRHGNRPDFTAAAAPADAERLYERVITQLRARGIRVATGSFGAAMQVELVNDGPMTVVLTVRDGKVQARTRREPDTAH